MRLRRTRPVVRIIILALIVYAFITLLGVGRKLGRARELLEASGAAAAELQEENEALEFDMAHADEEETIERIAREKLGLVLPDDTILYDVGD